MRRKRSKIEYEVSMRVYYGPRRSHSHLKGVVLTAWVESTTARNAIRRVENILPDGAWWEDGYAAASTRKREPTP